MDTKIKTGLGLIIILILVTTIGVFVWKAKEKNQVSIQIANLQKSPLIEQQEATKNIVDKGICEENKTYKNKEECICKKEWLDYSIFESYLGGGGFINEMYECDYNTSTWQTYRNEKYGFEVKYPKDWVINPSDPKKITLNSPENEQNRKDIENGKMYGEGYLEDIIFSYYNSLSDEPENSGNNINAKTLDEFVNKNQQISNKERITLSGDNAWSMTRGGFGVYYTILDMHNGHLYEIMFGRKIDKSDLSATENQILSTFKFID